MKEHSAMQVKMPIDYKVPLQLFQKIQESMKLMKELKYC